MNELNGGLASMSVAKEIADERCRQRAQEGWTDQHDDEHRHGEMLVAAWCYMEHAWKNSDATPEAYAYWPLDSMHPPGLWPWHESWWKPKSPRRDLIRAAALIVAEIERLDRAPVQS
jgi:hypothetical protein